MPVKTDFVKFAQLSGEGHLIDRALFELDLDMRGPVYCMIESSVVNDGLSVKDALNLHAYPILKEKRRLIEKANNDRLKYLAEKKKRKVRAFDEAIFFSGQMERVRVIDMGEGSGEWVVHTPESTARELGVI